MDNLIISIFSGILSYILLLNKDSLTDDIKLSEETVNLELNI